MHLRLYIFFGQFLWLVSVLNGKSFQGVPGYGRNLLIKAIPAIEDYQSNIYEVFMEPYLYELGSSFPLGSERSDKQIEFPVVPQPAPGLRAIAQLQPDEESGVGGELIFTQILPNGPVTIEGNVTGLSPGLHGLHVHQAGSIKDNCKEIGPHFIAYYVPQPAPGLRAIAQLQPDEESGVGGELIFTQILPNGPVTIEGNVTGLSPGLHGLHVHQAGSIKDNCKEIGPHFIAYYGRHGGPRDQIRHVGDLGNIKAEEGETLKVKIVDHLISLAGPRSVVGRSIAISKSEDDYGRAGTEDSALTGTSGPAIACGIIGYLN